MFRSSKSIQKNILHPPSSLINGGKRIARGITLSFRPNYILSSSETQQIPSKYMCVNNHS
jgi:hypothetical protein